MVRKGPTLVVLKFDFALLRQKGNRTTYLRGLQSDWWSVHGRVLLEVLMTFFLCYGSQPAVERVEDHLAKVRLA